MTSGHGGTPEGSGPHDTGTAAILRALGSLMAALGTEQSSVGERPVARRPAAPASRPASAAPAWQPPRADSEPEDEGNEGTARDSNPPREVALLLSDARERAQQILDESIERATELLTPGWRALPGSDFEGLDEVRRSVSDLVDSMHDVERRLDRIEALLEETPAALRGRGVDAPAETDEPRTGGLSVVPPQRSPREAQPPRVSPLPPPPPGVPSSAVPPTAPPPPPAERAAASQRMDRPAVRFAGQEPEPFSPPTAPAYRPSAPSAPIATFTPLEGSVLVRVLPVPGFQGLMRLQDALSRMAEIRQATVEAYSQGEARLRLDLATEVGSDQIAAALAMGLGREAEVAEASERDRSVLITLS